MKDPTALVDHVYTTYVEMYCNSFTASGLWSRKETQRRLRAQGKEISEISLFSVLYTETTIPLCGFPGHNKHVYLNDMYEGHLNIPCKLYKFKEVEENAVPCVKFSEHDKSNEAPECTLCVLEPDETITQSLLSTCSKLSKSQPVTHLMMKDISCEDLTSAEVPTISRNAKAVWVGNCDFPLCFWRNILHQLSDCEDLHTLILEINSKQLEEDLDELLEKLDTKRNATKRQIAVVLAGNLSEHFVKKWEERSSGILCHFNAESDSSNEDEFTLDGIDWLIENNDNNSLDDTAILHEDEQVHSTGEICLSKEIITHDLPKIFETSPPPERLVLRNCTISDTALATLLGLPICNSVTVLDFGGTKLGYNAEHMRLIIELGKMKQLLLPDCGIPSTALDHLLPALTSCKELTHLNLSGNNLEAYGFDLAKAITAWGDKSTLKEINLSHCSLTKEACVALLFALGNSNFLAKLILTGNLIKGCLTWFLPNPYKGLRCLQELCIDHTRLNKEDLLHLSQLIIENKLPCLNELHLANNYLCTMEDELDNLVETCVIFHQTNLRLKLWLNNLSHAFMNKVINLCRNSKVKPYFGSENLQPKEEKETPDIETALDLGGTHLGHNAKHIIDVISRGQLKELCLRDCQIPPHVCSQIVAALSACKNITHLNLSENTLSNCKMELADAILAWGENPPLLELDLSHCLLPADISRRLLSVLGNCDQLINLNLQGNTLTACLTSFLKDPHEVLHSMERLFLNSTLLNREDISHLVQLIERRKLPILRELDLASNALHRMEDVVENLIEACVTHHLSELKLNVCFNNLSYSTKDRCKSLCSNIDFAWTKDDFLEGFYDDDADDDDDDDMETNEEEIIDKDEGVKD